jgi:hypothetical protein
VSELIRFEGFSEKCLLGQIINNRGSTSILPESSVEARTVPRCHDAMTSDDRPNGYFQFLGDCKACDGEI